MNRKATLTVSISGIVALALMAIFVVSGASAATRSAAPAEQAQAESSAAACPLNGAVHSDGMPAHCDMDTMPEHCNMADMPEDCQQMLADGCMGSGNMMGMHGNMMGQHGNMMGMHGNTMGQHGTAMQGMAGCPMMGSHAENESDATAH